MLTYWQVKGIFAFLNAYYRVELLTLSYNIIGLNIKYI